MSIEQSQTHYPWMILDTENGAPFSSTMMVEHGTTPIERIDISSPIPDIRWYLARKPFNPLVAVDIETNGIGTGFEGYFAGEDTEEIMMRIINLGRNALDSIARRSRFGSLTQKIDAFTYDKSHPIPSQDIWKELDTAMGAILARCRAHRSMHLPAIEYKDLIYQTANRNPNLIQIAKLQPEDGDLSLRWTIKDTPNMLSTCPSQQSVLSLLNTLPTREMEAFKFMQELGRVGNAFVRKLAQEQKLLW